MAKTHLLAFLLKLCVQESCIILYFVFRIILLRLCEISNDYLLSCMTIRSEASGMGSYSLWGGARFPTGVPNTGRDAMIGFSALCSFQSTGLRARQLVGWAGCGRGKLSSRALENDTAFWSAVKEDREGESKTVPLCSEFGRWLSHRLNRF